MTFDAASIGYLKELCFPVYKRLKSPTFVSQSDFTSHDNSSDYFYN